MTKIEWCDEVWNPVTGCSPISEGCVHCYAKRMSNRLKGRFGYPEDEPFRVTFHPDKLNQPSKWRKPRKIFVVSMGDLFHDDVKFIAYRNIAFQLYSNKRHTFLLLTKRPERMAEIVNEVFRYYYPDDWPFSNVYLGISAENQQTLDERTPVLLQIPAAKRFVSIEPMLGEIQTLPLYLTNKYEIDPNCPNSLDWVIIGGLSLPGGKIQAPDPKWIDNIVEQCDNAGVPLFIKENAQYHTIREEFPR